MFGGAERRRSSNVRFKQLFHELKQQFPTISDEVIEKCILEHASSISIKKNSNLIEALKASVNSRSSSEEPMGRASIVPNIPIPSPEPQQVLDSKSEENVSSTSHCRKLRNFSKEIFGSSAEQISSASCPESEIVEGRKRNKLSSLLSKTTKVSRGLLKADEIYRSKKKHKKTKVNAEETAHKRIKRISKLHSLNFRKTNSSSDEIIQGDSSTSSSSRETTPISDQKEIEEAFPTVSELRQQFEATSLNEKTSQRPRSKSTPPSRGSSEMNVLPQQPPNTPTPKRPTTLALNSIDLKNPNSWKKSIQPSEKCRNLPKLLNANILSDKPPRSPVHPKKFINTNSKTKSENITVNNGNSPNSVSEEQHLKKKETVSTPTQTGDTLLEGDPASGSVNLSFNVNCSMDLIKSPVTSRRPIATSTLQVTPETPWLPEQPTSPRSYTSVNLTLRPPSTTPQPPIDITSQNSSLTYSTSSFDSQKGLQSRLQITVGPSGSNVIASRLKLKSPDFDDDIPGINKNIQPAMTPPEKQGDSEIIVKQQARIEHLRIELINEKTRLIVLNKEISDLENRNSADIQKLELKRKIAHLRCQCRNLVQELNDFDEPEFYRNLYRGQPLDVNENRISSRMRQSYPSATNVVAHHQDSTMEWNCHICTFRNHPEMNKCEQCEMPRLIHGRILTSFGSVNPNAMLNNVNIRMQN